MNKSVAFVSPVNKTTSDSTEKIKLFNDEKAAIKAEFAALGNVVDWNDPVVQKQLKAIAKQVINKTTNFTSVNDMIPLILPTEEIDPGDTFVMSEVYGGNIYQSTCGASVRMSRPQFVKYSATTNTKEVGMKLELTQIAKGKYSPSELGEYIGNLILAWRNRLLFTTTLAGMTAYQSGGAQYEAGTSLAVATVLSAIENLTEDAESKFMIGRRFAMHKLVTMTNSNWSDATLDEVKRFGMIGSYAGVPVMKVNSWTDKEYGLISPFPATDLWIFSDLPAGRYIRESSIRTSSETIAQNETMNMFWRWGDGIGIFWTDRISRIGAIT